MLLNECQKKHFIAFIHTSSLVTLCWTKGEENLMLTLFSLHRFFREESEPVEENQSSLKTREQNEIMYPFFDPRIIKTLSYIHST